MMFSLSAHRCLRQCQRQYYYRYLLASHKARDPLRHEAFLLKQLTSTEAWTGNLIHQCLERIVPSALSANGTVDWTAATDETIRRMHRQFAFSAARKYREPGIVKGKEPDYCALLIHEEKWRESVDVLEGVEESVRLAFSNLSKMPDLWTRLMGHQNYQSEDEFWVKYEEETIRVKLDLHYLHRAGHPAIIDWKCYRSMGGSDAAPQLYLYAWALLQQPNWMQYDPASFELLEIMPLSGELKQHPFNADRMAEVDDQLFEAVREIRRVFGTGKQDEIDVAELAYANSPGTCAFCPHVEMCKGAVDATTLTEPVRDSKRKQLQLFLQVS